MIQVKHIKKVTIFLLMLVTTLSLVACTKKDNTPYGDLTNDNYASIEGINITEKDLYNNLRRQSDSFINEIIEEKLLSGYLAKANELLGETNIDQSVTPAKKDSYEEWAQNAFDELVNQAIFSTSDYEAIHKLKPEERSLLIEKYADSLFTSNKNVKRDDVMNEIEAFVLTARFNEDKELNTFARGYYTSKTIRPDYIIELQKRLLAKEELERINDQSSKDLKKNKKDDNYIKDYQVINYYKSNEKGRTDTNVFYFHFLSTAEANAAFRNFNVKMSSTGNYYEIPDIRNYNEYDGLAGNVKTYVDEIIAKAKIKSSSLEENDEKPGYTKIKESEYRKYYDEFSPTNANAGLTQMNSKDVLDTFVKMYNIVNPSSELRMKDANDLNNFELEYTNGNDYDGNRTYDELQQVNSTLASYIYSTLTEEKPYSSLRSVGNYRYLVFQIEPTDAEIDYVSQDKDEDDFEKWVTVDELKDYYTDETDDNKKYRENLIKALKDGDFMTSNDEVDWDKVETEMNKNKELYYERLFKSKITSGLGSSQLTKLINDDSKIEIYDSIIRALYNQNATTQAKGSNKDGDIILTFTSKKDKELNFTITVKELFDRMEVALGISAASDELVNEILLKEFNKADGIFSTLTKDQLDKLQTKEFNKEYKTLIKNFSNDQFASSGYPASIGRENFLLLMFGTTDKTEAIEKGFLIPQLRNLYTSGFDIKRDGFDMYEFLTTYSDNLYTHYEGLKVSHLLVYYDKDGDGTPEKPEEYIKDFTPQELADHIALIEALYELIKVELQTRKDTIGGKLESIVSDYEKAARIPLGIDEESNKWSEFRKAGLHIKFEDISSEITNSSNFPTNSSTLDPVFYDRAMQLYARLMAERDLNEDLVDEGLPYLDMGKTAVNETGLDLNQGENLSDLLQNLQTDGTSTDEYGIRSNFGYHFILIDEILEKSSAKFDASKDSNKDYQYIDENEKDANGNPKEYNVYNTKDTLSKGQIEYYIKSSKIDEGLLMPAAVTTAISKYYTPVIELYNNQFTKTSLFFGLVNEINFVKHNSDKDVFNALKEINEKQFRGYIELDKNENYNKLYGNWFTDLKVN